VQIVIPARNEESNIGHLVSSLRHELGESASIVVVNNRSSDTTHLLALRAGANAVLEEPCVGKGYAVWRGVQASMPGPVFVCDGDIQGLCANNIHSAFSVSYVTGAPVVRIAIGRAPIDAPVTSLLARPLLRALNIADVEEPLGGLMIVDREFLLAQHLPSGWGFDVAVTIAATRKAGCLPEVRVPGIVHRHKDLESYLAIADEVAAAVVRVSEIMSWDHCDCLLCAKP
jgi:glucosyl-3-phosphoglycerate synthase